MSFTNRYGFFDRMLHRVAFGSSLAQVGLGDFEDRMFRDELANVQEGPPVFITALPRAGTTMLLELIAALPEFAAHTYREMPFVLTPMLWRKFAGKKTAAESRERAHGDGIQVSLDSPEAFEEMVWMRFFRSHYRSDRITPFARWHNPEFVEFFAKHRQKIIALRKRDDAASARYVSKNNQNIARLEHLTSCLGPSAAEASVLVAVRDPLQHAASLRRQHERFAAMHRDDSFARRYMAGIGHFDFGANLKPVHFDGWLDDRAAEGDPMTMRFWVDYWIATYRHVLSVAAADPRVHIVAFEALGNPTTLAPIASAIGIGGRSQAALDAQIHRLRTAKAHQVDLDAATRHRLESDARPLYEALGAQSILPLS